VIIPPIYNYIEVNGEWHKFLLGTTDTIRGKIIVIGDCDWMRSWIGQATEFFIDSTWKVAPQQWDNVRPNIAAFHSHFL